jgi:hypothetical protein
MAFSETMPLTGMVHIKLYTFILSGNCSYPCFQEHQNTTDKRAPHNENMSQLGVSFMFLIIPNTMAKNSYAYLGNKYLIIWTNNPDLKYTLNTIKYYLPNLCYQYC